jgi:hypothetical protein
MLMDGGLRDHRAGNHRPPGVLPEEFEIVAVFCALKIGKEHKTKRFSKIANL